MQPEQRGDHDHLIQIKDEILERFQALPPEHQASLQLVLVRHLMQGEWGAWFIQAFARLYFPLGPFPTVDRSELALADFTQEEINQLSDADITSIGRRMRNHYDADLYGDELRFHTEQVLSSKQQSKPSKGDSDD